MDKKELTEEIYQRTELTREQAKIAVDALFDVMKENLQARTTIAIGGFGTFKPVFPVETKVVGTGTSPLVPPVGVTFGPAIGLIQALGGPRGPGGGEDD